VAVGIGGLVGSGGGDGNRGEEVFEGRETEIVDRLLVDGV
jgi:hypothetical protein